MKHYTPRECNELLKTGLAEKLKDLLADEKSAIDDLEKIKNRKITSEIYGRKKAGRIYFSEVRGRREKGITGDRDRIFDLVKNDRANILLPQHRFNRRKLIELISTLEAEEYTAERTARNMSLMSEKCIPYDFLDWPEEKIRWALTEYETNPYFLEDLIYQTKSGLWTRSKSERRIADAFGDYHLLFRYEPRWVFNGRTVYADFEIWRDPGEIVAWEHRGAMHIEDYRNREAGLLDWYGDQGFSQHDNLIITHEEDIETAEQIEKIISRFLT